MQETQVVEEVQAPTRREYLPSPGVDLHAVVMMLEGVNLIPPTPVAEDAPANGVNASNLALTNEKLSPEGYVSTPTRTVSPFDASTPGEIEMAIEHISVETLKAEADAFESEVPGTPEIPDEITSD